MMQRPVIATKGQFYCDRLLREKPATTAGGLRYTIYNDGWHIKTETGGYYVATDYPRVFGWPLATEKDIEKVVIIPPREIKYKGYKYQRVDT